MEPKKIIILYYSKTGNTKLLAKRIFEIGNHYLMDKNVEIEFMEAQDLEIDKLKNADAIVIGSPDYLDYPSGYIKLFFDEIYEMPKEFRDKPAFTFITHGGGGKAAKFLDELAQKVNLKLVSKCISVKEDKIDKKVEKKIIAAFQQLMPLIDVKADF